MLAACLTALCIPFSERPAFSVRGDTQPVLQAKPSGSPISQLRFRRGSSVPLTVTPTHSSAREMPGHGRRSSTASTAPDLRHTRFVFGPSVFGGDFAEDAVKLCERIRVKGGAGEVGGCGHAVGDGHAADACGLGGQCSVQSESYNAGHLLLSLVTPDFATLRFPNGYVLLVALFMSRVLQTVIQLPSALVSFFSHSRFSTHFMLAYPFGMGIMRMDTRIQLWTFATWNSGYLSF